MNRVYLPDGIAVERALAVGTAAAATAAVCGAVLVYFAWTWFTRHTRFRLLGGLLATPFLGAVYYLAATLLIGVAYLQLNEPPASENDPTAVIFVHPGPLHKLTPAVAILATWGALTMLQIVRQRRSPAA